MAFTPAAVTVYVTVAPKTSDFAVFVADAAPRLDIFIGVSRSLGLDGGL